ncbi:MAG TPA: outer membrane beta-barrel protein [Vicinamibacterales bacterium]|nr:outer membrane beta-barrel protein [Vicinamibacterales bacterium]
MRFTTAAATIAALIGIAGIPAEAQTQFQPAPPVRGFLSANGMFQTTASTFTERFEFQEFVETGSIDTRFATKPSAGLDGSAGVRLWRNLGIGVGITSHAPGSQAGGGEVTARIPHPFEFNRHREITGQAGLKRKETAIHGSLLYFFPVNAKVLAIIGGGPTFFQAEQSFVNDVRYDHEYPYDTATFRGVERDNESASGVGLHASLDVAWRLSRSFGVGGVVRYSQANLPFTPADRSVKVEVGGVQAGLGVRVLF